MDLRWRTRVSYQRAAVVGSGLSQYKWRVSKVTNFDHVLSSSLDLLKIFSKKLHCSSETCGRSQTVKEDD